MPCTDCTRCTAPASKHPEHQHSASRLRAVGTGPRAGVRLRPAGRAHPATPAAASRCSRSETGVRAHLDLLDRVGSERVRLDGQALRGGAVSVRIYDPAPRGGAHACQRPACPAHQGAGRRKVPAGLPQKEQQHAVKHLGQSVLPRHTRAAAVPRRAIQRPPRPAWAVCNRQDRITRRLRTQQCQVYPIVQLHPWWGVAARRGQHRLAGAHSRCEEEAACAGTVPGR